MNEFQVKEWHKHLAIGGATLFFTILTATVMRNFVYNHPLFSIILILASVPISIPFFRFILPQVRSMKFLSKYLPVMMLGIIVALMLLSLTSYFILAFLLILHAISCIFLKMFKRNHIGIEIVLLITVLCGVAYGAKTGAIMGAISMLMDYIFSGRLSMFSIVTIPTYALIGVMSSYFATANIFTLGVSMAIFYSLFSWIFILGFMGGDLDKCIRFGITNVGFNALVFASFAPTLLIIMR